MKRLKSLLEVDFSPLSNVESRSTKGGGRWVSLNGQATYLLVGTEFDEVDVYAEDLSSQSSSFDNGAHSGLSGHPFRYYPDTF